MSWGCVGDKDITALDMSLFEPWAHSTPLPYSFDNGEPTSFEPGQFIIVVRCICFVMPLSTKQSIVQVGDRLCRSHPQRAKLEVVVPVVFWLCGGHPVYFSSFLCPPDLQKTTFGTIAQHHNLDDVFPNVKEHSKIQMSSSQVVSYVISEARESDKASCPAEHCSVSPAVTTGSLGWVNGIVVVISPCASLQDVDRILRLAVPFNALFPHPEVWAVYCGCESTTVSCFNIGVQNYNIIVMSLALMKQLFQNFKNRQTLEAFRKT